MLLTRSTRRLVPKSLNAANMLSLARTATRSCTQDHRASLSTTLPIQNEAIETAPEPPHIKAIVDQIAQLKFYEVTLLNEALKRELKISDVQKVVAVAGEAAPGDGTQEGESAQANVKTAFTVKLTKFDDTKKVALIKEIKKLVEGMNLVEAKRFVEDCPRVVRANVAKEEAETLQKQLEAAGGVVKLE